MAFAALLPAAVAGCMLAIFLGKLVSGGTGRSLRGHAAEVNSRWVC